ncbi:MAG: putative molybdenum carrier protein [Deltaproteobacteria bacterium]|nr:putative molybdenum carrier protein [Deltaproteobacteria bacterium]
MIKKIISGGQTGVDRAALDAAIKLTIPHGGWIPQGRLTENGPLPPEYRLKETDNTSYSDRTEKNVLAADGTLIISRGPLTGGSEYTREMAVRHNRLWLHIDLKQIPAFQAAVAINDWISKREIEILNVAGPRASKDPKIYKDTLNIIESAYYLGLVRSGMSGAEAVNDPISETVNLPSQKPQSIDEAVERLIFQMPLKDKTTVANMSQDELPNLYLTLGGYIMNNFGLLSGNQKLIESCRLEAGGSFQHEEDAVAIIIKELWEKLQQTHRLRVMK